MCRWGEEEVGEGGGEEVGGYGEEGGRKWGDMGRRWGGGGRKWEMEGYNLSPPSAELSASHGGDCLEEQIMN